MLLLTEPEAGKSTKRTIDGTERRRGLRIQSNRPIKVYEPTTSRYFGGQTEDISATGLRVELPAYAPVRVGEVLNIHVGQGEGGQSLAHRRQMLASRVVWVKRDMSRMDGKLEAGVEFLASISAHLDAA